LPARHRVDACLRCEFDSTTQNRSMIRVAEHPLK